MLRSKRAEGVGVPGTRPHALDLAAVVALLGACAAEPEPDERPATSGASGSSDATTAPGSGGTSGSSATETMSGGPSCDGTFAAVRSEVFDAYCTDSGCHSGQDPAGALDLSTADAETALVGRASGTCDGAILVVPGDPDASFLVEKLEAQPSCGTRMPVGIALPDELTQCVRDWLREVSIDCPTCGAASCVDLDTDPTHCGACDAPCPPGVACSGGTCRCPGDLVACGGACVDVQSDPTHCGDCGQPCSEALVCLAGECSASCGDLADCGGACVDTQTSPLHCGDCNTPCAGDELCVEGTCGCSANDLSYAADIEPVLTSECTSMGCHGAPNPSADLDLRSGQGYAAMVDVPSTQCDARRLVDPGAPGNSYLLDKILGVNLCSGSKMPKSGPGLDATQTEMISAWICAGAPP